MAVIELSSRFPRLRTRLVWSFALLSFAAMSAWLCRAPATAPPRLKIVHVDEEMVREGYSTASWVGGVGIQLPAHNPARMFRVDPSDRMGMFQPGGTVDYFLEDPWAHRRCSRAPFLLDFAASAPAPDVFVVDGNLWIDSHRARFFSASTGGSPVTIVVRGDVHIADDVMLRDGVLTIVALKRANGEGGAIFVDDPTFATPPTRVDATLAAEVGVHMQPGVVGTHVTSVVAAMPRM